MDLRQLRYFEQVVEAKSFTRAGELLHVAQPALSHHILKLEAELGQKLLIRHSRGVELTDAGERLLAYARKINQLLNRVREDLRDLREEPSGHVRLGLPYSLSDPLAIDLLQCCRQRYPKMSLAVAEHLSGYLTELLLAGRLDFVLTYSVDQFDELTYVPILQERFCFVEHAERPAKLIGEIGFSEVAEHPLILPSSGHFSRRLIDNTARYCGLRLAVTYEVDALLVSMEMVSRGLAATVQPFLGVRRAVASQPVTVRAITRPEISRRLHLAYPKQQQLSAPKRVFKELVLERLCQFAVETGLSPLVQLEIPQRTLIHPLEPYDLNPKQRVL